MSMSQLIESVYALYSEVCYGTCVLYLFMNFDPIFFVNRYHVQLIYKLNFKVMFNAWLIYIPDCNHFVSLVACLDL